MNIRFGINQFYKQTWTTILSTFHIRFPLACEDQRHVLPTIFPFETIWSRRQIEIKFSIRSSRPVSFQVSLPNILPPSPISISRALRLNDVSRWKKRKEKKKREKGKISNRVLNWSNRWQEWKLHIFSRPVTELSLPLSLSLFLSFSTKEFELFYYIEYHFTLESILLYSRCRLSSRFAILFISNHKI